MRTHHVWNPGVSKEHKAIIERADATGAAADKVVFDVWEKLERKHITFTPGKTAGVFPLCYLPGIWAMFVVFGETDEQVLSLKHECGECFPKDDRPGVWQSGGGMMPNIFREQR